MLFISPYQVILFLILLLSTIVFALVLASRKENNTRFLIWGATIMFVPFIGALTYIISYYFNKNKTN